MFECVLPKLVPFLHSVLARLVELELQLLPMAAQVLVVAASLALEFEPEESGAEDERQVHRQVGDHDGDRAVANVIPRLHVGHERREAQNCVHRQHQDQLVEVLRLRLRTRLVHVLPDYDDLDDDLRRHDEDLPNELLADEANGDSKHHASHQEEARLHEHLVWRIQVELLVQRAKLLLHGSRL